MAQERTLDEKGKVHQSKDQVQVKQRPIGHELAKPGLAGLQQTIGNRAVQRLIQRSGGDGPFELDDDTAGRINRMRGGGQPLDAGVQAQMSAATGYDLSDVRVHTSAEANDLSRQISAKAFTTGRDIFFREGAYSPGSGSGQHLISHELTHVVQQSTGAVSGSGAGMTVNPPGDAFEQEADAAASSVAGSLGGQVQRQVEEEEEETLQRQALEEEEEEEMVQTQEMEEEEEIL